MLKVFSIFAVFLHKYAGHAEPKLYLVKTQAEADISGTKGVDYQLEEIEPEKSSKIVHTHVCITLKLNICIVFTISAFWAGSIIELPCPCACVCLCVFPRNHKTPTFGGYEHLWSKIALLILHCHGMTK